MLLQLEGSATIVDSSSPNRGFIVAEGRILEIDAIADPHRVLRVASPILGASGQEGIDFPTC